MLAFASESRTMLGGVETVFRQSFERAESVLNKIGLSTPNSNGIPTVMLESGAGPAVNGVVPVPASMSNDDAMEVDA